MRHLVELVRARQETHRAALRRGVGKRHPGGDDIVGVEPPIGRILVPGDEGRVVRLLDEEIGRPAEQVRPQQILHRVEDARMVDDLVGPAEQQMDLVAHVGMDRVAGLALIGLQPVAVAPRLRRGEGAEREDIAVAGIGRDLGLGQHFTHGPFLAAGGSVAGEARRDGSPDAPAGRPVGFVGEGPAAPGGGAVEAGAAEPVEIEAGAVRRPVGGVHRRQKGAVGHFRQRVGGRRTGCATSRYVRLPRPEAAAARAAIGRPVEEFPRPARYAPRARAPARRPPRGTAARPRNPAGPAATPASARCTIRTTPPRARGP